MKKNNKLDKNSIRKSESPDVEIVYRKSKSTAQLGYIDSKYAFIGPHRSAYATDQDFYELIDLQEEFFLRNPDVISFHSFYRALRITEQDYYRWCQKSPLLTQSRELCHSILMHNREQLVLQRKMDPNMFIRRYHKPDFVMREYLQEERKERIDEKLQVAAMATNAFATATQPITIVAPSWTREED